MRWSTSLALCRAALLVLAAAAADPRAAAAQGAAAPGPYDSVPRQEILDRLNEDIAYLQHGREAAAAAPQGPAAAAGPHDRVRSELVDFYEANLAPLRSSRQKFLLGTVPPVVWRLELDRLAAAMDQVRQQEAALQQFAQQERPISEAEGALLAKVDAIYRELRDLAVQYQAKDGRIKAPFDANFGREAAALTAPLPDLSRQLETLDRQDLALAATYRRVVLTFELPVAYVGDNTVTPLIDGDATFRRMGELIDDVAANGHGQGYVHLSMWSLQVRTRLNGQTFLEAMRKLVADGDEVAVTLWGPGAFETQKIHLGEEQARINGEAKAALEALGGRVHVRLQEHPSPIGAFHQKLLIAFNGSTVRAIVGGINLQGAQAGAAPHPGSSGGWTDVHDVAAEIVGPATWAIEKDFDRRWADGYDPLFSWATVAGGDRIPIAGPTRPTPGGNDEVAIATTDPQRLSYDPGPSVRDELIARVNAARSFIYLENYSIHEESLIRAIGRRIAAEKLAGRDLPVIILVRMPSDEIAKWLHEITYLHLGFVACDSFTYLDEQGQTHTIERAQQGRRRWEVGPYQGSLILGNFYQDTKVFWDDGEAKLASIISFTPDRPLYTLVYLPPEPIQRPTMMSNPVFRQVQPVWVHSKVSIFDDAYAGIGSANFNPRSLYLDGEMTAFIHGPAAPALRQALWHEYFSTLPAPPSPQGWAAEAARNLANFAELPRGREYVLPLDAADLVGSVPYGTSVGRIVSDITQGATPY
jgi:phosphatidylserine/phosphatidylglycerophosphate/cardiolipin synthase-like enzyme